MRLIDLDELERQLALQHNMFDDRSIFVSNTLYDAVRTVGVVPIEKLAGEIKAYCDAAETCVE